MSVLTRKTATAKPRRGLIAAAITIVMSAASVVAATPAWADTVSVRWVMVNTPAGSTDVTYPMYLSGSDKAPKCGHHEEFATYNYSRKTRKEVDAILAAGVLKSKKTDADVLVSATYLDQKACPTGPHVKVDFTCDYLVLSVYRYPRRSYSVAKVYIAGRLYKLDTTRFKSSNSYDLYTRKVKVRRHWRITIRSMAYAGSTGTPQTRTVAHGAYGPCT